VGPNPADFQSPASRAAQRRASPAQKSTQAGTPARSAANRRLQASRSLVFGF
jgi:hypothetical protein